MLNMFELTNNRNVRIRIGNTVIIKNMSIAPDVANAVEVGILSQRYISCIAVLTYALYNSSASMVKAQRHSMAPLSG